MQSTNFLAIFLTGLFTGGLTCMAVQGGLLAAMIAQREEEKEAEKDSSRKGEAMPILSFVVAKLVAYTILGLLLGWLGSFFQLSVAARTVLSFAVALFMIGTALALLDAHPIFRYFIIQPPKFLTRLVRNRAKSRDTFAPAILGAFTVFIPCGTTQAMMALAIASGSAIRGAGILYVFILGTSPLFFILGYFATRLGDFWHKKFLRVAAYAIIILALFNANNALALTGRPITFGQLAKSAFCSIAYCENSANSSTAATAVSQQTITIGRSGYTPNIFAVKAGAPVTLHLVNQDGSNCIQAFTIPTLGIQKIVPVGASADISFVAPQQKGQLAFMCSMGMYRGTITIN